MEKDRTRDEPTLRDILDLIIECRQLIEEMRKSK